MSLTSSNYGISDKLIQFIQNRLFRPHNIIEIVKRLDEEIEGMCDACERRDCDSCDREPRYNEGYL